MTFRQGLTGIVGDNGAGKSTLMKILSGVIAPDEGDIWLNDKKVQFSSPIAAKRAGVESLYQELALADTLDVTSNIFLGREITRSLLGVRILKHRDMAASARVTLQQVQINIPDVTAMVRSLSGGQRQAVAVPLGDPFQRPGRLVGRTHRRARPPRDGFRERDHRAPGGTRQVGHHGDSQHPPDHHHGDANCRDAGWKDRVGG